MRGLSARLNAGRWLQCAGQLLPLLLLLVLVLPPRHSATADRLAPAASTTSAPSATSLKPGQPSGGAVTSKPTVNMLAVFEEGDYDDYQRVFQAALTELNNASAKVRFEGKAMVARRDLHAGVQELCHRLDTTSVHLIIAFANVTTVHSINMVASSMGLPILGYMVDKHSTHVEIHHPLYLSMMPSNMHLAEGLTKLLAVNLWYRFTLLIQEDLRNDGFYHRLRALTTDLKWNVEREIFITPSFSETRLSERLQVAAGNRSKIFIVHTSYTLALRIFRLVNQLGLGKEKEFAWIMTDSAFTRDEDDLAVYPPGTLAFLMNSAISIEELLIDSLSLVSTAVKDNLGVAYSSSFRKNRTCWTLPSISESHNSLFNAIKRTSIYGLTGPLNFDDEGTLNTSAFKVKNLVFDGRLNVWRDIGCIQGNDVKPFGIIWPGDAKRPQTPTQGKKRYRVVTNPVQPFVMQEAPHPDYGMCITDTLCLNLTSRDKRDALRAIQDYEEGVDNNSFIIHCCRGLAIDLLNKLASDLDFDFVLYIVQDETYGQNINGTWDGMMHDLIEQTAHFAVGAFSITKVRSAAIDFTDPYFFSGFSILYSDRTRETSIYAFLEPFSINVWFAIFVSATITAICMAVFEWNSPFGLNPWGRKRKQNYTFASGLTMVYSVLFGHTVKTKSPKAWPSKVMQNLWAFASIFIIASYTANLAAFIAGKHAGIYYNDVKDPRLPNIKLGVLPGSAVDEFLKKVGSQLVEVSNRNAVPKTDTGIKMVIAGKLDALLGDYPILDYARAHLAPNCELKLLSRIFGDDRYGIGLPKGSPLKMALSKKIQEYHDNGYIDDLIDVHFADAQCFKQRISQDDSQLGVLHHAGLFVMMCVGVAVGIVVCFIEHAAYKWLVPYFRRKPKESYWKSVHVMFISQRLHRCVTSAELVAAHDSAREMFGIVKKREFARLFQKSTIRKNRLADMAKTKRINRNFYDIVEKAKWMKEMRDNNLMDDSSPTSAKIIEIPLKNLGANSDASGPLQEHGESSQADPDTREETAVTIEPEEDDDDDDDDNESHSNDRLLGDQEEVLGGVTPPSDSQLFLAGLDDLSDSSNLSLPRRHSDGERVQVPFYLDIPPNNADLNISPHRTPPHSPRGSLHRVPFDRLSLPNGEVAAPMCEACVSSENDANNRLENLEGQNKLSKAPSDDSHNFLSSMYSKCLLPKTNNMVRSMLHKTHSYQDHLCSVEDTQGPFSIDKVSKEELLIMWKTSEIELNRRLEQALREKARLERRLAQLQKPSVV